MFLLKSGFRFLFLSFCLSVFQSFCLAVFLSFCLAVFLSFCLSVFLFASSIYRYRVARVAETEKRCPPSTSDKISSPLVSQLVSNNTIHSPPRVQLLNKYFILSYDFDTRQNLQVLCSSSNWRYFIPKVIRPHSSMAPNGKNGTVTMSILGRV